MDKMIALSPGSFPEGQVQFFVVGLFLLHAKVQYGYIRVFEFEMRKEIG